MRVGTLSGLKEILGIATQGSRNARTLGWELANAFGVGLGWELANAFGVDSDACLRQSGCVLAATCSFRRE
jgi:hypothetical protein